MSKKTVKTLKKDWENLCAALFPAGFSSNNTTSWVTGSVHRSVDPSVRRSVVSNAVCKEWLAPQLDHNHVIMMVALLAWALLEKSCGGKKWWQPDDGAGGSGSLIFFTIVR